MAWNGSRWSVAKFILRSNIATQPASKRFGAISLPSAYKSKSKDGFVWSATRNASSHNGAEIPASGRSQLSSRNAMPVPRAARVVSTGAFGKPNASATGLFADANPAETRIGLILFIPRRQNLVPLAARELRRQGTEMTGISH